uniref:NADH dehydrogenase subunit 4L n=1 Tax=Xyloredo nooi TaxID=2584333 RepID=UPI0020297C31|nr:NADH dehydrogenase subunit 4L [Xyloredo nooi]UPX88992.1 NADH dehydrogenase subunit 4L [Xyloredo nooi]UPX89004.1 NADH dehydrogenase subunit 4L [Xyloredo nooi]
MVSVEICLLFLGILLLNLMGKGLDFFSVLIYLEVLVLVVFVGSFFSLVAVGSGVSCYVLVAYLCFGVCEAVVGLSLLVSAARGKASYSKGSFTIQSV